MISNNKIGQTHAKFDNVIDNIFKFFCGMNFYKRDNFLLATYNPTQPQPIRGSPFLVSPCVIPCYKIIPIKNSVCVQDDNIFKVVCGMNIHR